MIAVSTLMLPTIRSSTAIPLCPNLPSAQAAATAAAATKAAKPSAGRSAMGFPGCAGASDFGALRYSHRPAPHATSTAGSSRIDTAGSARVANTAMRTGTRRYMTAVASAIPAGSAPP